MAVALLLAMPSGSDSAPIQPPGEGNPWIRLRNGVNLPAMYIGEPEPVQLMEDGLVQPLTLTSGDLNADGVPDLISGYASSGIGLVTVHRGNADSNFPNSAGAKQYKAQGTFSDLPFLSPANVFALPVAPEFLATGDFTGDGRLDVIAAAHGDSSLYVMPGDGRGGLGPASATGLPGAVTALAVGEFNHADGSVDVVVGIVANEGPKLLVFESGVGGLRAAPETLALPGEATAFGFGRWDEDPIMDLAVAAGQEVLMIGGRNRPLAPDATSMDNAGQSATPTAPATRRILLPFTAVSVAAGDFGSDGRHRTTLALLAEDGMVHILEPAPDGEWGLRPDARKGTRNPITMADRPPRLLVTARMSGLTGADLVVMDQDSRQVNLLPNTDETGRLRQGVAQSEASLVSLDIAGEPAAVLPMRMNGDALSDLVVLQQGQSTPTVVLTQAAATFTVNSKADEEDGMLGDGICDTGTPATGRTGICTLRAALVEADQTLELDEVRFNIASLDVRILVNGNLGSLGALRPVIVDGTSQPGSHRVTIDGSQAGMFDAGGGEVVGFELTGEGSTVRGLEIIHFALDGFRIRPSGQPVGGNLVEGNVIAENGRHGVHILQSSRNTIGGTTEAARNVIESNGGDGVLIGGEDASENRVQGNRIQMNKGDAVRDNDAPNTIIGDNQISSKENGVHIEGSPAKGVRVHDNFFEGGTEGGFQAGIFSEGGDELSVCGNVMTNTGGIAIRLETKVSGKYSVDHNSITGKTGVVVQGTAAPGVDVTINITDTFAEGAEKGLVFTESAGGKVNWNVLRNDIETEGTALNAVFMGEGIKNFTNSTYKAKVGTAVNFKTLIPVGVQATAMIGGDVSGGTDGLAANTEVRGRFAYDLRQLFVHDTGRKGIAINVFADVNAKVSLSASDVDVSRTGRVGFEIKNLANSLNSIEVFVEKTSGKNVFVGFSISGFIKLFNRDNVFADNREAGMILSGNVDATIAGDTITGNGIGVLVQDTARATIVGNTLSGNGVALALAGTGSGSLLSANSIFANASLGIDLGHDGVTPNDPGDGDSGPNNLQNFPELTSIIPAGDNTTVQGLLNSTPDTRYTLEFFANSACDPSGFGEGEIFLGSTEALTDNSGNASFAATFSGAAANVTATATDPDGNTSEFSQCASVQPPPPPPPPAFTCNGLLATIVGTNNSETITGTPGPDVIVARRGNDVVFGLQGNDVICGGPGNDQLFGNQGKDQLFGEAGNDVLMGGTGNDRLFGNQGKDQLFGQAGNDVLMGGTGNDRLFGNQGKDQLFGQAGNDVLKGGTGNDQLFGQEGNDAMDGQLGNDDNCNGGIGTDTATSCEQTLSVP